MNIAKITPFPDQKRFKLNDAMYGLFLEEMNHSQDGGLYAELVQNRNFSNAVLPEGTVYFDEKVRTCNGHRANHAVKDELPSWRINICGDAIAKIEPWFLNPRNPSVPNQLKLIVAGSAVGTVELINEGFWGMAIEPEEYRLTIIARSEGVSALVASIRTPDGKTIASARIDGLADTFNKITVCMTAQVKATQCELVLTPVSDGVIYFDFVSLFPVNTFCARENGVNRHLAKMLLDLKPGFVRFPGGCIVEGITLENAYRFKNVIGPAEDRPGCWDLWGYRRTDGFGYHEFLQFCEDIGAKAMYVINCAMSCQARFCELADKPLWDDFLQDAINAIEYAIAPMSTEMGALRAKHGHPEPFNLTYIEIGNENHGPAYEERYRYFYSALKKRFPDLLYIVNDCEIRNHPPYDFDYVDEHFYTTTDQFPAMAHRYDKYDREHFKVYIGEYAVRDECGLGNMASAASEASFMINMERNGDVVHMASYSESMCHINDRTWDVNMICFQDDKIFGIPSYYVQKLFSECKPETIIATDVNISSFTGEALLHAVSGIAGDGGLIVKAVNFSYKETQLEMVVPKEYTLSRVFEIASANPTDENSLTDPQKVCIKEISFADEIILKPYAVYAFKYSHS